VALIVRPLPIVSMLPLTAPTALTTSAVNKKIFVAPSAPHQANASTTHNAPNVWDSIVLPRPPADRIVSPAANAKRTLVAANHVLVRSVLNPEHVVEVVEAMIGATRAALSVHTRHSVALTLPTKSGWLLLPSRNNNYGRTKCV